MGSSHGQHERGIEQSRRLDLLRQQTCIPDRIVGKLAMIQCQKMHMLLHDLGTPEFYLYSCICHCLEYKGTKRQSFRPQMDQPHASPPPKYAPSLPCMQCPQE